MKRILLVRHAKSSWDFPALKDHDRPLNDRGKNDISLIQPTVKSFLGKLDQIYSSTATRAKATVLGLTDAKNVAWSKELYCFNEEGISNFVKALPNDQNFVMLVGHNPALTDFINAYSDSFIQNLPTTGVVLLLWKEQKDWKSLEEQSGKIVLVDTPRRYKV